MSLSFREIQPELLNELEYIDAETLAKAWKLLSVLRAVYNLDTHELELSYRTPAPTPFVSINLDAGEYGPGERVTGQPAVKLSQPLVNALREVCGWQGKI